MQGGLLLVFFTGVSLTYGFKLNLIAVIIGENPLYGYVSSGAAYDVAYEKVRTIYPHLFVNATRYMIHKPGIYSCVDSAALMYSVAGEVSALLDTLVGFNIILCPGR